MVAALNGESTPCLYMLTVPAVISDGFCGIEYDGITTVSLWDGVLNAHPLANSEVTSEFLPLPLRGVAVTTTGPRTLSLTTRPSPPKRPRHVSLTVEEPSLYRALLHALSLSAISPRGIRLLRPLGRGGQGRVYLGRTLKNKLLAVKLIPGDSTEGIRESELSLHAPQSENVVQTHFTRVCSTHTLIATEYVAGATLHEAATAGKGMDTEFLQRVAKCVLNGIYDLHRAGIAHRDVKLENVLLSEDGSIKICDLGSGASFRDGASMRWRGTISTLYVAAPELSRGDCHGPEVDLWAAGALLLALRTRRAMLGGKHRERVISAMTEKENCGEDTLPVVMTKEEIREAPELFCDLLRGLLKVEVSKRLTAEQALKNKWVQGHLGNSLKSNRVQRIRGKVRAIVRLVLLWRSAVTARAAEALAPSSTFLPVTVR